jgi:hypothetical protein
LPRYSGFAFPVGETLYLLGEQKDREYEILSMLSRLSLIRALIACLAKTGLQVGDHQLAPKPILQEAIVSPGGAVTSVSP